MMHSAASRPAQTSTHVSKHLVSSRSGEKKREVSEGFERGTISKCSLQFAAYGTHGKQYVWQHALHKLQQLTRSYCCSALYKESVVSKELTEVLTLMITALRSFTSLRLLPV
eukprot:13975-Heterococcus_DN1.PRE.2